MEDLLTERGRQPMRQLLQDHLDLPTLREEADHAAAAVAAGRSRVGRALATVVGPVTVRRLP
ncbi:hypothetical protein [Streptomyces ipomoeae]|uniref:hypothetical protein n=1 Tax=Streptomyces ipomoeae TaxID=103232 RepID=UPI0035A65BB4